MKLSDYVVDFITKQGVSHIFEFIGGAIVHLLDSAYDRDDIQCVSMHHEQSGSFAAEAYARINGNLGVVMATSGPGALNMVTSIGSCYFDSVPCLFITGQVNTYEYKFDQPVRQIGFQETDIVSVVKPIVKYTAMVTDATRIRFELEKAIYLAQHGRKGPVLLDLPMDIQRAQIEPKELPSFFASEEYKVLSRERDVDVQIDEVVCMLTQAKRPVVLVGGGVRSANAAEALGMLVERTAIPVVSSLMGLDAVSHDYPEFMGMIGSYGNRYSNLAVANCDFLLVLGSRLDTRQTGTRPDTFARAAQIVQVDIDAAELGNKIAVDLCIQCDVKLFLERLNQKIKGCKMPNIENWRERLHFYEKQYPTQSQLTASPMIEPNWLMTTLSRYGQEGDIICVDVGQHQMWAAQSFRLKKGQRMLNSGGMGAMGFALPAAIGAAKARPGAQVIVIVGDGGIQLNIQELDIAVKHGLPIKIVVLNNKCLGMVRQFQDLYFSGRRQSTVKGYTAPDICKVAEAYGLQAYSIADMSQVESGLQKAFEETGAALINVWLELDTVVSPKLVVNCPIEDMSPHLDREELKSLMLIDFVEEMEVPK